MAAVHFRNRPCEIKHHAIFVYVVLVNRQPQFAEFIYRFDIKELFEVLRFKRKPFTQ